MLQSGGAQVTLDKHIHREKKKCMHKSRLNTKTLEFQRSDRIVNNGHLRKKTERERIWGDGIRGKGGEIVIT